jgi:hypothetical protein
LRIARGLHAFAQPKDAARVRGIHQQRLCVVLGGGFVLAQQLLCERA